jgi:hypothetical protein
MPHAWAVRRNPAGGRDSHGDRHAHQIMTLTGIRGAIAINSLSLPRVPQLLSIAVSLPLFGGISVFGASSILGVPFIPDVSGAEPDRHRRGPVAHRRHGKLYRRWL